MSMYGLRISRMMETMHQPQTDSNRLQQSNSPSNRDINNESHGVNTTQTHTRTQSALERNLYFDTKMNSTHKKKIGDSKRYLDNSLNLNQKLIFRDDQRHFGDLHQQMLQIALQEKKKGDTHAVNQMCNQLLEEMNRTTIKDRRPYRQGTERINDLNQTVTMGFALAPEQPYRSTNMTFLKEEPETKGSVDLKSLVQEPTQLQKLTRKHNLAARGHIGHARNLSSNITFKNQFLELDKDQRVDFKPGWQVLNSDLKQTRKYDRVIPPLDQQHKIFWDHDKLRFHMYTTGKFSSHLDAQMGISFEDLEHMSIRQQRHIIQARAKQMIKNQRLKFRFQHNASFSAVSSEFSSPNRSLRDICYQRNFGHKNSVDTRIQDGAEIDSRQYVTINNRSPTFKKSKDTLTVQTIDNADQSTYHHRQSSVYESTATPSIPTKMQKHSIEKINKVRRSGKLRNSGLANVGIDSHIPFKGRNYVSIQQRSTGANFVSTIPHAPSPKVVPLQYLNQTLHVHTHSSNNNNSFNIPNYKIKDNLNVHRGGSTTKHYSRLNKSSADQFAPCNLAASTQEGSREKEE